MSDVEMKLIMMEIEKIESILDRIELVLHEDDISSDYDISLDYEEDLDSWHEEPKIESYYSWSGVYKKIAGLFKW